MSDTPARTVDQALERFTLVRGSTGSEDTGEACAMTALAWTAGEAWTDHPPCAHHLIADLAIAANDDATTTETERAQIVRAGAVGIIDTWWVPTEVVVAAIASAPKDGTWFARCMSVLAAVTAWKAATPKPRAYLRGANLGGANLRDANLRGAYLRDAYLRGANLGDANLRGANLRDAYLRGANLGGANLRGANLGDAYLGGANLRGANLRGANLRGANLGGANLRDANLRGAYLRDAYGTPLSGVPVGWVLSDAGLFMRAEVSS